MEIKPFKAFRFDGKVVGDTGSCIAPPYDVINDQQVDALYKKNQYNIVRISKGKTTQSDNEGNNQYTRAAGFLSDWIKKGVLKQDDAETIYGYVQDFDIAGAHYTRSTFIALGKLEEFGKIVRPHETTLSKPKMDRLLLTRATVAQIGLIFLLYKDEAKVADKIIERALKGKPLIDFTDEQDVRHRLFGITDKNDVAAIVKMMGGKSCVIADGHHRYETGLNYYKETGNPAALHLMMAFANTENKGLVVLATHRLVNNLENFDAEKFIGSLKENFQLMSYNFDSSKTKNAAKQKMLSQMRDEYNKGKIAFGIYTGHDGFYVAVLKDKSVMDKLAPDKSPAWRSLDLAVLHKLILDKVLGLDEAKVTAGGNVEYVKDTPSAIDDSIAKTDAGKVQVAILTNPPKMDQINAVADAGEKMPQKSTFFYPKVYTGLTINKL
jgi:uncharacterized protein (DUF1015 family)